MRRLHRISRESMRWLALALALLLLAYPLALSGCTASTQGLASQAQEKRRSCPTPPACPRPSSTP